MKPETGSSQSLPAKVSNEYSWISDPAKALIYAANRTQKIGEFSDTNQYADLIKVLTEWRIYLGIRDEMTDVELELCTRFLKEEYSHFTLEKIRLAIKYSLKGELKVDIKPYGAFSPLYISTILNAYEKYNNRVVSDILRDKDRKEQEQRNKPVELSEADKLRSRIEGLMYYQSQVHEKYLTDFKGVMWYVLTKNGIIDPSALERFDLREKATKYLESSADITKAITIDEAKHDLLVKYYAMKEYFTSHHIDFTTYTSDQLL